jgi:nucleotide-binding universal stress UspA family protein
MRRMPVEPRRAMLEAQPSRRRKMDEAPILIGYDGSDDARRAVDYAAVLFRDRRAVVLDVGPVITPAESLVVLTPGPYAFEEYNRSEAASTADEGVRHARAAGLVADARAEVVAPTWQGVVDVADEIDAAVIVMGSRGLNGAREFFEGSLSHEVVQHAGRPVLIVPPRR